jgi:hypothetical protein
MRAMRGCVVMALGLAVGCAQPRRVVLEPEETVTHTWVGDKAPSAAPEARAEEPQAPPPAAPPPPAPAAAQPAASETEAADAEAASPTRRPWTKAGAWGR